MRKFRECRPDRVWILDFEIVSVTIKCSVDSKNSEIAIPKSEIKLYLCAVIKEVSHFNFQAHFYRVQNLAILPFNRSFLLSNELSDQITGGIITG